MIRLDRSLSQIHSIERKAWQNGWLNQFHPLCKLIITIYFVILTVSFSKYDLTGLLGMILYLVILFQLGDYSLMDGFQRMKLIFPILVIMGIANPFFDRTVLTHIGTLPLTGGMISMCTLLIKGLFTVFAAYLLVISTPIEKICHALRLLHLPKILVTVVLLIYRYLTLFMEEALLLSQAYALRAPLQKGVQFRSWGSLIGQFLLRSIDRSREIFQSMLLRGYTGDYEAESQSSFNGKDFIFLICFGISLTLLRIFPVFTIVGKLVIH